MAKFHKVAKMKAPVIDSEKNDQSRQVKRFTRDPRESDLMGNSEEAFINSTIQYDFSVICFKMNLKGTIYFRSDSAVLCVILVVFVAAHKGQSSHLRKR